MPRRVHCGNQVKWNMHHRNSSMPQKTQIQVGEPAVFREKAIREHALVWWHPLFGLMPNKGSQAPAANWTLHGVRVHVLRRSGRIPLASNKCCKKMFNYWISLTNCQSCIALRKISVCCKCSTELHISVFFRCGSESNIKCSANELERQSAWQVTEGATLRVTVQNMAHIP